ncbi:MAG: hypothetical protein V7735_07350 [Photobacterium frigidiphilum]|uniref:hypothetical protein n=1 Tax=Photobacterium frigidiphilum TaxID=264736 RepID=UPI003002C605
MNQQRAENLYFYLRQQHAPQKDINAVLKLLRKNYSIDLAQLEKRYRKTLGYSPNRFDINTYGTAGSRTMNQTRQMQKDEIH